MGDVYARMAQGLGAQGGDGWGSLGGWTFGDVLDAGHGRLQVVCTGLTLGPDELHVPSGLVYTWETDQGQDHYLRAGDNLLMLVTSDRQDYYILQKSPWG